MQRQQRQRQLLRLQRQLQQQLQQLQPMAVSLSCPPLGRCLVPAQRCFSVFWRATLVLAALASGETTLEMALRSDDTDVLSRALASLGAAVDGLRVVASGLKANEKVVVNGLQRVRPGVLVQPQEVPMNAKPELQAHKTAQAGERS